MLYISFTHDHTYLGDKGQSQHHSGECEQEATEHSTISIQEVTKKDSTKNHSHKNEEGDVGDDRDVFIIVESFDLHFPGEEGQQNSHQMSNNDVTVEYSNPYEAPGSFTHQVSVIVQYSILLGK